MDFPGYKSYIEWRVEIWEDNNKIYNYTLDLKDQRVYIHLESKSVGDTLAWFPYVEEFRKNTTVKLYVLHFIIAGLLQNIPKSNL